MQKITLTILRVQIFFATIYLLVVLAEMFGILDRYPKSVPYLSFVIILLGLIIFLSKFTPIFNKWINRKN